MEKLINFEKDVKRKLLLFSITPLLLLSMLLIGKIYFLTADTYEIHYKITLVNINHKINLFVANIYKKASLLSKDPKIDLRTFILSDDSIDFVCFLEKDGTIRDIEYKKDKLFSKDMIDRLYKKYRKLNKPFFAHDAVGSDLQTLSYVFNTTKGLCILNVNLREIRDYINFIKKDERFQIAIVDDNGKYIFCTSKNIDKNEPFFKSEIYKKAIMGHKQFSYYEFYNSKMDLDNFFMYTKNMRLNWIVFVIDESETLDDQVLIMITWISLFVLSIILLILTLSDKFVKKILNPLEELVLKMETFANSRNTQRFNIHSEYIFFKKLSDSFNKMQDKILKREEELDILNKTLEKRVKEEVEKNRLKDQQLISQSRLAQMGEMLSMIAHQWRQPLSAISSLSGKININARLKKLDHQTALELSSKISLYTQHLSSTIEDFRNFFRGDKEKKDTTYDEIVNDVLVILEVSIKNKNIELVKDMQSKKVFHTYANEIKQVVLNLVKNAEDVLVERGIKDPKIIISSRDNVLTVEDNAGGIPDEIMDKIFDPYFSTKEKKDGTGLGLYMSRIIIQDHCGGKLIAENTDKGALFKIIL
ncbi:MAG: hypothetical protein GXO12_06770 [Epsilonproteobacteria bacterium]|nr:hypothetical protein [Campylobacterota bacterium]